LKDFSCGDARLEIEVEKLRSSTLQLIILLRKGGKKLIDLASVLSRKNSNTQLQS
jgi:hypothetical protein